MKKQLTLADVAGYLPYDLLWGFLDGDSYHLGKTHLHIDPSGVDMPLMGGYLPFLHPMSDLTKPMTHPDINNWAEFVPLIEMAKRGYGECFENGDSWNVCDKFKNTVRCTKTKSNEYFLFGFDYHLNGNIYFELLSNKYDGDNIPQQPFYYNIDFLTQIEFLSRLHFDYNDLIGQGLAIDINTLK